MATRLERSAPVAAHVAGESLVRRWLAYLATPVDGSSLALFRICFGAIMLWEVWRYFSNGWIARYYIDPSFFFSYIPFIRPWPGDWMYVHFLGLGLLAALIACGLFYRLAAWLFFLGFSYVFLLDKTQYLNHFYLISLVSLMMAIVPAQRRWSLDSLRDKRSTDGKVPRWSLHILRAHIVIVYFFGGIAKLNDDWLRGEPIGSWLLARADMPLVGPLLALPATGLLFAYGGLLIDFSVGWLLLWRRTFWLGAAVALVFNITNAMVFSIGIFPYFMLAALVLFPRPDWPRRLLGQQHADTRRGRRAATTPSQPVQLGRGQLALLALLHVYLLVQLALPLRHWLYPGDVNWTEEGHRFAWRMKLRDKDVDFVMLATDPRSGERWAVEPRDYLTNRQYSKMVARPDMIHQFAHYVADLHEREAGVRPQIQVRAFASLNDRPAEDLIDTNVDLAAQPWTLGPASWIKHATLGR
jgi:vitamin K-dependent gamma-carboxylase